MYLKEKNLVVHILLVKYLISAPWKDWTYSSKVGTSAENESADKEAEADFGSQSERKYKEQKSGAKKRTPHTKNLFTNEEAGQFLPERR